MWTLVVRRLAPDQMLDALTTKWKRPGPPTSLAFSFTAFGAVLFGRRHSASILVSSPHKRRPSCRYSTPKNEFVNRYIGSLTESFDEGLCSEQQYCEAIREYSPESPRFAATLGNGLNATLDLNGVVPGSRMRAWNIFIIWFMLREPSGKQVRWMRQTLNWRFDYGMEK
jgi:hypothetical protein